MIVVELANGHIAQVEADKREVAFLFGRNRRIVYFLTFAELEAVKRAADQDAKEPAPAGGTSELIHEIEVNHKCKCGHWNGDHSESDDGGRRVCMHLGCDCIIDTAPAGGEATK